MSLFEFVTVMISMILALALGQLLMFASSLAKRRANLVTYAPYTLWIVYIYLTLINHWWSLWDLRDITWSYAAFLYMLIPPTLIFFGVGLLVFKVKRDGRLDLQARFEQVRPLFMMIMIGYVLSMWFDGPLLAGQDPLGLIGLMHTPIVALYVVGLVSTNRGVQVAVPLLGTSALIAIMVTRFLA